MKKTLIIAISLIAPLFLTAQENAGNKMTTQETQVKPIAQEVLSSKQMKEFDKVSFTGRISVKMIRAEQNQIEIRLYNISSNKFTWSVDKGELSAKLKSGTEENYAEITLYYKDVKHIDASSSAEVIMDSTDFKALDFNIQSSGYVEFTGKVKDLKISISGNSTGLFKGEGTYITILATNNAKLNTQLFLARSADVKSSALAEVMVYASERIVAEAQTKSKILYLGTPELLRIETWSLGTVGELPTSDKPAK